MKTTIKVILVFFAVINASFSQEKTIKKGTEISMNSAFSSNNGTYALKLQDDGNLTLYKGTKALWSTATEGKIVKACAFQSDGNLVVYGYNKNAIWASNTQNKGEVLKLQNDGNLVIYDKNEKAIWSTDTWDRTPKIIAPAVEQYVEADITTVNVAGSRYTSFGKCKMLKTDNKLSCLYNQRFSDRKLFDGDLDRTHLELDLNTNTATLTYLSWGHNKETYKMTPQANGKLLMATNNDRTVIISLNN